MCTSFARADGRDTVAAPIHTAIPIVDTSALRMSPPSRLHLLHVLETAARNRLGIGREVEHLDRDPPIVVSLAKRREDRSEIHLAKSRPSQIRIVRVKMAGG